MLHDISVHKKRDLLVNKFLLNFNTFVTQFFCL